MKQKVYIFILIFVICFFPTKIFGYFATPDKYIHSMPFGSQRNNPAIQDMAVPSPVLDPTNNQNFDNNEKKNCR